MGTTGPKVRPNDFDKLQEIIAEMDVPSQRKGDLRWLSRNLGVRNSNHPRFGEAVILIKKLTFQKD